MIKIAFHSIVFLLLTILTQIGGVIYLLTLFLIRKKRKNQRLKRFLFFTIIYTLSTFLIAPYIAPIFGRQKIDNHYRIENHNFLTRLCNRNYVTTEAHNVLTDVSLRFHKFYPDTKIVYLDANFPFFDGFPMLPHLSHNDGKKIDFSFIYKDQNGKVTNDKPSNSGYGVFEEPRSNEVNQNQICQKNGSWYYDYPKYLTFGSTSELQLDIERTKKLIELMVNNSKVKKVFLEPHLKQRWKLNSNKIRFHGCKAVRHDDHIHVEMK